MTLSPRLDDDWIDRYPNAYDMPASHTPAEIDWLVELALARDAKTIVMGHDNSVEAARGARAFTAAWLTAGGEMQDVIIWPARAASWLRHAERFTAPHPDLWLMGGSPAGWAQMVRRLVWSTDWKPKKTLGFASVSTPVAMELANPVHLEGLTGATHDGDTWTVKNYQLIRPKVPATIA